MAIARSTGRVTIIHTDGGEREFSCGGARAQAKAVQFDQSGATLAVGTTDGQVCMVTTDHGEQLWSSSTTSGVVHLTFSHEGSRLATQSENGTVAVWAAGDGQAILKLSTTGYPNGLAFAGPGDRYLVTANRGDDVRIWSVGTGSPVGKIPRNTDSDAFDTGTGLAAAVGSDGDVLVWQIDGRAGRWSLDLGEEIKEIRKAESSDTLSARGYATVKVWDASRARELVLLNQPPGPPYGHFERVVVSPDGTMFAALLSTGIALFYKLPTGRQQFALSVPTLASIGIQSDNTDQYRLSVALHSVAPSAPLVMCATGPAPLIDFSQANPKLPEKVWEECVAETGVVEGTFATDLWRGLITFSPDGKLAAVAILNNLLIVDTSDGKTLGTLKHGYEHRPDLFSHVMPFGFLPTVIMNVAFFDGSSRALTISSAGVARSWSVISSDSRLIETRKLPGHVFPPENGQICLCLRSR